MHLPGLVIGPKSHVQSVLSLCDFYSKTGVCMLGFYGMAGIGKTTIAKAVYNQIQGEFDGFSFVADVRERSENNKLHSLQEQLLSEILKKENFFNIHNNVDRGKCLIKARLSRKKVLIVLDDVDDESQIKALAGERSWFYSGSTIIFTTRSEHLLDVAGVDYKYKVTRLDDISSTRLFCFHAFKDSMIPENLDHELVKDVARLGGGVPLALEVLGSLLHKKGDQVWKSTLDDLKSLVHCDSIQKALKVSYDSLDEKSKEIFLDMACFFIGVHQDYASLVLTGCSRFFSWGQEVLIERCLLKVEHNKYLWMHDLVRDMAREIIRKESPEKPQKRSRLWFHEDIRYVLDSNKGSEQIEGISAIHPKLKDMTVNTSAFARMDRLKILQARGMDLTGSFKNVFADLRWLSWQNCPLYCLPTDIHLNKLVALDMQYSNITEAWRSTIKPLESLKHLNLSHCYQLQKSPDFSCAKNLETVVFEGCCVLAKVDSSIEYLVKLVRLSMKDCISLEDLPSSICKLESLEHLNLSGCSGLQQLPADLGSLTNLRSLSLQGCIRSLKAQTWRTYILSFVPWTRRSSSSCPVRLLPPSISGLCLLTELNLRDCGLLEADIPDNLGSLTSLKYLDLGGNDFYGLQSLLCQLSKLNILVLDNCKNLQFLSQLPSNLRELHANNCSSMRMLDMSNYKILPELHVSNSDRLSEIKGMETIQNVEYVRMESSSKVASLFFSESFFQLTGERDEDLPRPTCFFVAGSEVPEWFSNQNTGYQITLTMPPNIGQKFQGMILWSIYESRDVVFKYSPVLEVTDHNSKVTWVLIYRSTTVTPNKRSWVSFIPRDYFRPALGGGEKITFSCSIREQGFTALNVTKCGVHPVYVSTGGRDLPELQFRDPRSNFEERRFIPLWRPSNIVSLAHVRLYTLKSGADGQHIQKVLFNKLRLSEDGDGTSSLHNIIGTPFHVNHDNLCQILQEAYDYSRLHTSDWRDLFCNVFFDGENNLCLSRHCWNCLIR